MEIINIAVSEQIRYYAHELSEAYRSKDKERFSLCFEKYVSLTDLRIKEVDKFIAEQEKLIAEQKKLNNRQRSNNSLRLVK